MPPSRKLSKESTTDENESNPRQQSVLEGLPTERRRASLDATDNEAMARLNSPETFVTSRVLTTTQ
jgi:hypothetical protein